MNHRRTEKDIKSTCDDDLVCFGAAWALAGKAHIQRGLVDSRLPGGILSDLNAIGLLSAFKHQALILHFFIRHLRTGEGARCTGNVPLHSGPLFGILRDAEIVTIFRVPHP